MKTPKGTYTAHEAEKALENGKTVYLHTFVGTHRVSWISDGRAHTPEANAGFGSTWHISGKCFEIEG